MHRIATLTILLVTTTARPTGAAAFQHFGETNFRAFNGKVVFTAAADGGPKQTISTVNLRPVLDSVWKQSRPKIAAKLREFNGRKVDGGVSVYDIDAHIPERVGLEAKPMDGGHSIRLVARGCSIAFKSTTPDVKVGPFGVGVGSYADPKLRLSFDVKCDVSLHASVSGDVSAKLESVTVENVDTRGANVTGWLAHALASVVKLVGGPDVQRGIREIMEARANAEISHALNGVKHEFGTRAPLRLKGTHSIVFDMRGQQLYVDLGNGSKSFQPQVIK